MLNIKDKTLPSLINLLLVLAMFFSINTYADLKKSPFDVVLPPDKELKLPSHKEFSGVYLNQSPLDSEFDFEFGFKEQKDEQEWLIGFDDNDASLSLDAQPNIELMDLNIQGVQPEALYDDSEIANRSANHSTNRAHNAYPGCADMALGQATQTGFTQAGQIQCRGIRITHKTKLEAVLVDIPKTANFDLYLFQVINGELKLKAHSSAGVGQTVERIVVMANPGVYVLAAKAQTYTAGSSALMAWFGYTQFDQQELNDSYAQATQINGIATVTGTMDHARDMDYFVYNFGNGQKNLSFKFVANETFILEVYTEKGWARAKMNKDHVISPLISNKAILRVVSAKNTPLSSSTYQISFREPLFVSKVTVSVVEDMQGFRFPVAYTQIRNNLTIRGKTLDQYGHPLAFAPVFLKYLIGSDTKIERVESNYKGEYEVNARLPDCSGEATFHTTISDYAAGYTHFYDFDYSYQSTNVIAYNPTAKEPEQTWYSQLCYVNMTSSCYRYMHPVTKKWVNTCR